MADRPLLRVALAQYGGDAPHDDLIAAGKAGGAEIVVFPEMLSIGYASYPRGDAEQRAAWRRRAIPLDSDFVQRFRQSARRHGVHVVTTLLEQSGPDPFNTALLIDPSGEIVLVHRKVHICDFDSPEDACGRGGRCDVAEIQTCAGPVTVGMMICMDREYADLAAALSAGGAEIMLVPNCCHLGTDPEVSDVRIAQARGRAFETVAAMAVTNYPRPKADGHSFAVDPLGRLLTLAGEDEELAFVDFDLDMIRRTRDAEWFRWRAPQKFAAE